MNKAKDVLFVPGKLYRRRDLHKEFGGQRQGEISTPAKAPFIFLITGESGTQHGYSDEWTNEGVFLYTGEGQRGHVGKGSLHSQFIHRRPPEDLPSDTGLRKDVHPFPTLPSARLPSLLLVP